VSLSFSLALFFPLWDRQEKLPAESGRRFQTRNRSRETKRKKMNKTDFFEFINSFDDIFFLFLVVVVVDGWVD
jgi:hypothetical protein